MSYVYLLGLHEFIDQRLAKAARSLEDTENGREEISFHKGRIEILSDFKIFLRKNFNHKLPRKIRESYFGTK